MSKNEVLKFGAVVTYYYPNEQAIKNTLALAQYVSVIVISNTDNVSAKCLTELTANENIFVMYNDHNCGVAKALNQGINYWITQGFDWCFLFDQDSQIDADFIKSMINELATSEPSTAAYVPLYFAENLQQYGDIIQVKANKIERLSVSSLDRTEAIWASYAISSGSLINLANYQEIGDHDEDLFIDFVDIEWGLRANSMGYRVVTNCRATLKQQLGDQPLLVFGKRIVNHSPLRHYYYFRNVVHMLKKRHVPFIWKVHELLKLPIRFLLYSLFTSKRHQHITAMATGLWHGIQNKKGIKT